MKQQKNKISVLEQQLRQNETLYHNACEVFGGSPRVFRHYSPAEEMSIDILTGTDTPRQGEVSCATLGVMHYPVGQRVGKKPLRFELCGICRAEYEDFPELISRCAVQIMTAQAKCTAGTVWEDSVRTYIPESKMHHILLAPFSLWDKPLSEQTFDDVCVRWMAVLLISEEEYAYLKQTGLNALLGLFEEKKEMLSDPLRESIL
ncbi:MAG: suppressor of fused domain protein [Oscillospiraceae bacterium]|nr:suppressor of fused domain protein [Oscillospiraceae bacterium]MDY3065631.1 suppressor of fused domain protein [Oscillospiraceae bacterium]